MGVAEMLLGVAFLRPSDSVLVAGLLLLQSLNPFEKLFKSWHAFCITYSWRLL